MNPFDVRWPPPCSDRRRSSSRGRLLVSEAAVRAEREAAEARRAKLEPEHRKQPRRHVTRQRPYTPRGSQP